MRRFHWGRVVVWGSCVVLSAAAAAQTPASPAVAPAPLASPQSAPSGPRICFDALFYGPLPGRTNYCLGLRDWKNGDYRQGLELLKLAAGWGNKNAQYTLGLIYYGGHHVAANPALGLAWLQLANERHNDPKIALATRSAVKWATRLQRHRAKQMFRKMRRKYGDKVATVRAWHHWRHWQKSHGRNSGLVCLYGAQLHAARQAGLVGTATAIAQALAQVSGGTHAICVGVTLPVRRHLVRKSADRYFAGWAGVVTVGPLDAVPEPAASSTR